jgi:hypothetical protein
MKSIASMVSVARRRDPLVLATIRVKCCSRSFESYLLFYWSAIFLFIVWTLGRYGVGVFPRLGTSRGDCQLLATVAECVPVRPPSLGHCVPLPSATALGLGFHRWPCSTCQPIMGSWRESVWILQVAHRPICTLPSRSALMLGPRRKSC